MKQLKFKPLYSLLNFVNESGNYTHYTLAHQ